MGVGDLSVDIYGPYKNGDPAIKTVIEADNSSGGTVGTSQKDFQIVGGKNVFVYAIFREAA